MSIAYARTGGHWMPCARKEEPAWRLAIAIRDGFKCVYCGVSFEDAAPKFVTLDHITPKSQGGQSQAADVVAACRPCNSARKTLSIREFVGAREERRILRSAANPINLPLAQSFIDGTF